MLTGKERQKKVSVGSARILKENPYNPIIGYLVRVDWIELIDFLRCESKRQRISHTHTHTPCMTFFRYPLEIYANQPMEEAN